MLEVEVLVLEGVVVLVREVHLLDCSDAALLGDDVELLADRVVEPGDLTREQLDVGVGQVGVLGEQPEPVVERSSAATSSGVSSSNEVLRTCDISSGDDDGRHDRFLLLEAADGPDLFVDLRVDGPTRRTQAGVAEALDGRGGRGALDVVADGVVDGLGLAQPGGDDRSGDRAAATEARRSREEVDRMPGPIVHAMARRARAGRCRFLNRLPSRPAISSP